MRFLVPAIVLFGALILSAAVRADEPTEAQIKEDKRKADETIAAARKAGENGEKLAKAIKDGDASTANTYVGQEINVGGKPTKRTKESWTIDCRVGITVVATKLTEEHNPEIRLEGDVASAWGKVKSIDMKSKTVTLEDTELIYVEYMPALHQGEK